MTPEEQQALVRWNLRHGNEASTGRVLAMGGDDNAGPSDWYRAGPSPPPPARGQPRAQPTATAANNADSTYGYGPGGTDYYGGPQATKSVDAISQDIANVGRRRQAPALHNAREIGGSYPGLLTPGNIDLTNRPDVANADGTHSSVRSMSFADRAGGPEILVPTVSDDGRIMSEDDAIDQYHATGRHLGQFSTPSAATLYAQQLHEQQAAQDTRRAQAIASGLGMRFLR